MSATMAKHSFILIFFFLCFCFGAGNIQGQTYLTASLNTPGNAGVLAENCGGPYELVLRRGPDNDSTTSIFISGSGTATIGTDYQFPPGSFPAEMEMTDSVLIIPVTVVNDGLSEGTETVHLEIAFLAGVTSDFITLETAIVDAYEVEIHAPSDTIVWCRNVPYVLLASSNTEEINWSPASFFDDSLGTSATVRPFDSGWYYATVGSDTCGAKDSVYFDLAIVEIANADTVYLCLDSMGVLLSGSLEGLATDFVWIPSDTTLSDPSILTPVATPTVTTTYILQSDIGVCTASDRVVVVVDSLPGDLHIAIAPAKPFYCAGEIVALFSPSFDTLSFPDISFMWIEQPPSGTFNTPLDLLNAALTLQDTTLYIRETTNNACMTRDSILINVVPPGVPLSVTDTMLCPGEMFTVEVLSDQVTDPEWTPADGLSCTKCLDPKVTVLGAPGTEMTYQFSGTINECPVGASLKITVPGLQPITITGDQVVCQGEMVPLTITNAGELSDIQWQVSSGNATLSCNDCIDPVVTINSTAGVTLVVTASTSNPNFCGAFGMFNLSQGISYQFPPKAIFACEGETVIASTGQAGVTDVQWNVLSGDLSLSCIECPEPVVTVNSMGRLQYFGEVAGEDTCRVNGIVEVNIFSEDIVLFEVLPAQPIGQGTNVMVTMMTPGFPLPSSIMWTINGTTITPTTPSIEFEASEEVNFIEVKFINSKGCEQTDTLSVPTVPPSYTIPNAFTPNGDMVNDNFRILINGNIEVIEFLIFNRWGQLVYEFTGDVNTGWDGRFKDEPAASDTYVYKARLRYPDGRTEIAKGDVMLLR